MNYESINLTIDNKIAVLTINRPESLNALNAQVFTDLDSAFDFLKDEKSVNCIIITGSGEKAFVAGADIKEFSTYSSEKAKPLIAAITGLFMFSIF